MARRKPRPRYYFAFEFLKDDKTLVRRDYCPHPFVPGVLEAFRGYKARDAWVEGADNRVTITRNNLPTGWQVKDIRDAIDYIPERKLHEAWDEAHG